MGTLGIHWGFGVAIDGMGSVSEAVFGVWGYLPGADGVCRVVFAGYGGVDSDR